MNVYLHFLKHHYFIPRNGMDKFVATPSSEMAEMPEDLLPSETVQEWKDTGNPVQPIEQLPIYGFQNQDSIDKLCKKECSNVSCHRTACNKPTARQRGSQRNKEIY